MITMLTSLCHRNPHGSTPKTARALTNHQSPNAPDLPPLPSHAFASHPLDKSGSYPGVSEHHETYQGADCPSPGHERDDQLTPLEFGGRAMPSSTPDLSLNVDPVRPNLPQRSDSIKGARPLKYPKRQASPSAKVSTFFGWGPSRQNTMESPSTQFSDGTPLSAQNQNAPHEHPPSPGYLGDDNYFASEDGYSTRSASPFSYGAAENAPSSDDIMRELTEVSAELAASIRREMELEDEVERMHAEMTVAPPDVNRRTSDYYSDSGTSSARLPIADPDLKMDGLEKMRRKAEQEKAQMRVDMAQKVQEDLNQRRALEMHIQSLEEQIRVRAYSTNEPTQKEQELEALLEDIKRRLNDERQSKSNFEDLFNGMKEALEAHRNERDNLRDEVVPQLRARLEGLESEVGEHQNLAYENTRIQQEVHSLRNENQTLVNARRLQLDMQQGNSRFKAIAEEEEPGSPRSGVSRSNSLARSKSMRKRSSSFLASSPKEQLPSEALPDRLKDIEEQRDALHRTLKSLILRQDQMTRKHTKQVRQLELERDKALQGSPRRAAFQFEVQTLRTEINHLRQRADEALEQKWQCEKGLSGLKMDLDRAQQETSSLRELLQEHDIVVPSDIDPSQSDSGSDPLDRAYAELRAAHEDSLAHVQGDDPERPASLEAAQNRMRALLHQVQQQQGSNKELRDRLAEAVGRGEQEQEASTKKINDLQSALRAAEERVMTAQNVSEDAVTKHEEHVRQVKEMIGEQSKRGVTTPSVGGAGLAIPSPHATTPTSALFSARSPRLGKTTSGKGVSVQEASRTAALEMRVKELEAAATRADEEMQGVVERMNKAQIEVAELQMQR